MTMTIKHLCDSCGAALQIDQEKQMFICPFCGINYDYEYFRDDDVHERMRIAIEKKEFNSAREAAEFILAKDPHDFKALQGLFMASSSIPSLRKVVTEEFIETVTCEKDTLDRIVEMAAEEDKEYFGLCRDLILKCDEYNRAKAAGKKADAELEKATKKRSELLGSKAARKSSAIAFAICAAIGLLAIFPPHMTAPLLITPHYWLFFAGSVFVFYININHKEKEQIEVFDNAVKDNEAKADAYDDRLDELMREMRMLLHDIMKK